MKHTTASIGKRVAVRLKSGERFVDKLSDIRSKYYEFKERGRIKKPDVISLAINKTQSSSS